MSLLASSDTSPLKIERIFAQQNPNRPVRDHRSLRFALASEFGFCLRSSSPRVRLLMTDYRVSSGPAATVFRLPYSVYLASVFFRLPDSVLFLHKRKQTRFLQGGQGRQERHLYDT